MLIGTFTAVALVIFLCVIGCLIGTIAFMKWRARNSGLEADTVTTVAAGGGMMGAPGGPGPGGGMPGQVITGPNGQVIGVTGQQTQQGMMGPGGRPIQARPGMINPATGMYQSPPPCGSAEAEFQNDFIQVFPMYHLEPQPEKNTTPYMTRQ